jgi:hypothetical protein
MKQEYFAYLLVFLAVATLAHRVWRRMRSGEGGCASGCSCSSAGQADKLGKRRELIELGIKAPATTEAMNSPSGTHHV